MTSSAGSGLGPPSAAAATTMRVVLDQLEAQPGLVEVHAHHKDAVAGEQHGVGVAVVERARERGVLRRALRSGVLLRFHGVFASAAVPPR